jgi:hypothetical protein
MKRLLTAAGMALALLATSHSTARACGPWAFAFCYQSPCGMIPSFGFTIPIPFTACCNGCDSNGAFCGYTPPQVGDALFSGGGCGGYGGQHGFMGAAGQGGGYPGAPLYQAPPYWYDH